MVLRTLARRAGDWTASGPTTSITSSGACSPASARLLRGLHRHGGGTGGDAAARLAVRRPGVHAQEADRAAPILTGADAQGGHLRAEPRSDREPRGRGSAASPADPPAWRAAVTVLLTAPMTPLLFMGQEWATCAPFQFFTDFDPSWVARSSKDGGASSAPSPSSHARGAERIPAPQAESDVRCEPAPLGRADRHGSRRGLPSASARCCSCAPRSWRCRPATRCACPADPIDDATSASRRGASRSCSSRGSAEPVSCPCGDQPSIGTLDTEDPALDPKIRPSPSDPAHGDAASLDRFLPVPARSFFSERDAS